MPEFQENEVLTLLLGIGALAFVLVMHRRLRRLPACGIMVSALGVMLLAWLATNLEAVRFSASAVTTKRWSNALNMLEHIGYAVSAALLLAWALLVYRTTRGRGP
ncbi:MAG: hypothetical protein KGY99_05940 [Phycisphaerae bacterium]|nr:hypothetical protein [Phycisphaerae bacterium]